MRESSTGPDAAIEVEAAAAARAQLSRAEVAVLAGLVGASGSPAWHEARAVIGAGAGLDWGALLQYVAAHELAAVLRRRGGELGLAVPDAVAGQLGVLARAATERGKRCQFTLCRFLQAAAVQGLPTTLLKGAALVGTIYLDPAERHMIDVDILVSAEHVTRARAVAASIGLGPGRASLPGWFHRLVHFEMLLQPRLQGMTSVDLHWRLHSPALLLTVDDARLWQRRRPCRVYGVATGTLDDCDQWLHLATHWFANQGATPDAIGSDDVAALLQDRSGIAHVKWLRDLVVATERLVGDTPATGLADRAAEWSAARQCAAGMALLRPLLSRPADEFAAAVARELERRHGAPLVRQGSARAPAMRAPDVAHPALGFRLQRLALLGGWVFPPRRYLAALRRQRRGRDATGRELALARISHAARVLARTLLAALALPLAFGGRTLAAPWRAAAQRRARGPGVVFELARSRALFERAFAERFGEQPGVPARRDPP